MSRSRSWCFTINNPTDDDLKDIKSWQTRGASYVIFQIECVTTEHIQGYAEFTESLTLGSVRQYSRRAHWEPRRGTQSDAITYCTKAESRIVGPVELGVRSQQGKRTDLESSYQILKSGGSMYEVMEAAPASFIRYHKGLDKVAQLLGSRKPRPVPDIRVRYGPPGSGKTRYVYDNHDSVYSPVVTKDKVWFDGYCGQPVVLFDDYYGEIPYAYFLKLLDRYPLLVEIKGGTVNFVPEIIYITSNQPPESWYGFGPHEALMRRLTDIKKITSIKDTTTDLLW